MTLCVIKLRYFPPVVISNVKSDGATHGLPIRQLPGIINLSMYF